MNRLPGITRIPGTVVVCSMMVMLLLGTEPGVAPSRVHAGNPYSLSHGLETLDHDGEHVRALRIPIHFTLRSWEDRPLGLRLRLAATFAASDLWDLLEQQLADVDVASFVPGLEFVIPIGPNHLLRPFVDAGIGANDATDTVAFLGGVGLRAELIFPRGATLLGLEPGLKISTNAGPGVRSESVINPFITMTARRVIGMQVGGYRPDAGVYFEAGYDFQAIEWTSVTASTDRIRTQFEVGAGVGFSHGRPGIGPFRVPRLRVGYRFGDLEGFRIRVGGDWLTTVVHEPRSPASR